VARHTDHWRYVRLKDISVYVYTTPFSIGYLLVCGGGIGVFADINERSLWSEPWRQARTITPGLIWRGRKAQQLWVIPSSESRHLSLWTISYLVNLRLRVRRSATLHWHLRSTGGPRVVAGWTQAYLMRRNAINNTLGSGGWSWMFERRHSTPAKQNWASTMDLEVILAFRHIYIIRNQSCTYKTQ
jgi:hypothetical protein